MFFNNLLKHGKQRPIFTEVMDFVNLFIACALICLTCETLHIWSGGGHGQPWGNAKSFDAEGGVTETMNLKKKLAAKERRDLKDKTRHCFVKVHHPEGELTFSYKS